MESAADSSFWSMFPNEGETNHEHIEDILERASYASEDERLEAVLDFDDVITECKNVNASLINLYECRLFLFCLFC